MAVNDVYELSLVQDYDTYKPVNVLHYKETTTGSINNQEISLAQQFDLSNLSTWAATVVAALKFLCIIVKRIEVQGGCPIIRSPLSIFSGTHASTSGLPGQDTAVIRKYPDNEHVPFYVGWTNVSGVPEDQVTRGIIDASYGVLLGALGGVLTNNLSLNGHTFEATIFSPTRKAATPPTTHVIPWSVSFENFAVKTLRRRRPFAHTFNP